MPFGDVKVDLRGGRHALNVPWSALAFDLFTAENANNVQLTGEIGAPAFITDRSPPPWNNLEIVQNLDVTPALPWKPNLPRFECTSVGTDKFTYGMGVNYSDGVNRLLGYVKGTEDVECYAREDKAEYTAETTTLGTGRIAPLAVPATGTVNLADHSGTYGYRVEVPPGATIRVCVSASMPAGVNYYPQYSPGFTFVDGAAGCTDLTNLDADNPNYVLIKVTGSGSPNNVTVTTTAL